MGRGVHFGVSTFLNVETTSATSVSLGCGDTILLEGRLPVSILDITVFLDCPGVAGILNV